MNNHLRRLARQYAAALKRYLADPQEAILARAYELGRASNARELGILDMARTHEQSLREWLQGTSAGKEAAIRKTAEPFLLESLSPFEVTHRGFRETNAHLQQLIATLEKRNTELAKINRTLQSEIRERKRTEKALRASEQHSRVLFAEARRMEEDLRNLSNQVLRAQEEERKRISRELHDEVGQALLAISVTLAALQQERTGNRETLNAKLADAQRLLQATMESVHGFARELRPAMLDELGLVPALRSYCLGFARRTGLAIQFRSNTLAERLDSDAKTVLYRVAQETFTNVVKHAKASRVTVNLRKIRDCICMEIADNGRSFHPETLNKPQAKLRLGLLGMRERVRLVNGRVVIIPLPGRGTTMRVTIPIHSGGTAKPTEARAPNLITARNSHRLKRLGST
ncbi:MAG: histidine kinase [Verrucomicrobiota bacterium]